MFRRVLLFIALAGSVVTAAAHEYRGMSTQVAVHEDYAHVVMQIAAADAILLSPSVDRNKDARVSVEEFKLGKGLLALDVSRAFSLTSDGTTASISKSEVEVSLTEGFTDEPHELKFTATFNAPAGTKFGKVFIDPNMFRGIDMSPITGIAVVNSQKNTVTIVDRGKRVTIQASGKETYVSDTAIASAASADGTTATATGVLASAGAAGGNDAEASTATSTGTSMGKLMGYFLWEGIVHIIFGWDHVLFVLGLLLLAGNLKSLIKVITAFTIAHSITLVIVSLNLISIDRPQIVEAIIAASIAYVGIENILRVDKTVQWRWVLVLGFGLIHGMGFAGSLAELLGSELVGRSTSQVVTCLLAFNVGVELGQIFVILLFFPALGWLRKHKPVAARRTIIAASCVVMFWGISFLLDRTFIPGRLPWIEWLG